MSQHFQPITFAELDGWSRDSHLEAFKCFLRSAAIMREIPPKSRMLGIDTNQLLHVGELALQSQIHNDEDARVFFESHFTPFAYEEPGISGFLTAYFEPELAASRNYSSEYSVPVYRRPDDLVDLDDHNRPDTLSSDYAFGRKTGSGIIEYFDRDAINRGALSGRGLELYWLKDPVDCYYMHVQGSARLRLEGGEFARISYAAKAGHPYTSIGRVLVDLGEMKLEEVTMQSIKDWLHQYPERQLEILAHNRSYIFFKDVDHIDIDSGPVGAAKVPLTAGRSLAIDRKLYPFGLPFWVKTEKWFAGMEHPLNKLMIAQDTGSAIIGPQRGDYFVGSGDQAGHIAGLAKHRAALFVLLPSAGWD